MRINHNIQALNAYRNLNQTMGATSKSLEKLSSGLRINKAADDAAGLAISEKMRSQIRGLDMAERNSLDAISLVQTAEGALSSTHDILQRMRELSIQAANGTLEETDREAIQSEINELTSEIDRIADTTQFNQKKLLNGSDTGRAFLETTNAQVDYKGLGVFGGTVTAAPSEPASARLDFPMSVGELNNAGIEGKKFTINGKVYEIDNAASPTAGLTASGNIAVNVTGWNTAATTDTAKIGNINTLVNALETAVRTADPSFTVAKTPATNAGAANDGQINPAALTFSTQNPMSPNEAADVSVAVDPTLTGARWTSPFTGGPATTFQANPEAASSERVSLTFSETPKEGDSLKLDGLTINFGKPAVPYTGGTASVTIDPEGKDLASVLEEIDGVVGSAIADPATKAPALDETFSVVGNTLTVGTIKTDDGAANGLEIEFKDSDFVANQGKALSVDFQIGANELEMLTLTVNPMDAAKLGIGRTADGTFLTVSGVNASQGVSVMTTEDASRAITLFDKAIQSVSEERSKLGAVQNRLEHTITNLQSANENLTAAESRIRDLDMAKEMSTFTKNNILNQAGQAMLAQANQLPQGILQLLQ
ncbi:flagellin [Jeotgalibacillus sp. ET6]|uniref:flagellin N-terminal helical domain-containing protein n=1 Tax=Jeotgalibacillus sp. ET6 TaxID=3037260 RepID=UPI0024186B29|nr:flagellin [Jeotgalibacillus sp. ET6]MDG5471599.1 flagellin [Jeotgalibacillus sp. ET6]